MIFSMAPTRLKSTERDTGIVGLGKMKRLEEKEMNRSVGRKRGKDEMQKGGRRVEEMWERGETFHSATVWETEGEKGGEWGREIIACLRAAILSCAMNTKDYTALQSTPLSLFFFAHPLKTQQNCSCRIIHRYLTYSKLSTSSIHDYWYLMSSGKDSTSLDTFSRDLCPAIKMYMWP